jgi:hypothetical protein
VVANLELAGVASAGPAGSQQLHWEAAGIGPVVIDASKEAAG